MTPASRRDQLLLQPVGDDLVVYDERTHKAHRLNATAALVWQRADGERAVHDLAADLRCVLQASDGPQGSAVDEETSEELVRLALEELDRAGLLIRALPAVNELMTRRKMITVAAALLPVVASIMTPTPAMAQFTPRPPTEFSVSVSVAYGHPGGETSQTCADGTTTPAQRGTYTVRWDGPGIIGTNSRTGPLRADGSFSDTQRISTTGRYTATVTIVNSDGVTRTTSASIDVTSAQGTCTR